MHRCLNIVEIIQNISDNILMGNYLGSPKAIVSEDEAGNSSDLLAFALTCRKFYDPAIDSLWYTVETTHPLTCLFPDDLFEDGKEENFFITSMPIRPMKPSDWVRFDFHARRVRVFLSGSRAMKRRRREFSLMSLQTFNVFRKEPLFPNLHKIEWDYPSAFYIPLAPLFMSPSLSDIFVRFPTPGAASCVLGYVEKNCPSVTTAVFHSPDKFPDDIQQDSKLYPFMNAAISSWSHCLTSISIGSPDSPFAIDESIFLSLAHLPMLDVMACCFHSDFDIKACVEDNFLNQRNVLGAFLKLTKLEITIDAKALDHAAALLRSITSKTLVKHVVYLRGQLWEDKIAPYIETLSHHGSLENFLLLRYCGGGIRYSSESIISFNTIRPLLRNRKLSLFKVELSLHLSDDHAHEMATSWPELRQISMSSDDLSTFGMSLCGLSSFVFHCPCLDSVQLPLAPFISESADWKQTLLQHRARQGRQYEIILYSIPKEAEDISKFAVFLSAIFPEDNLKIKGFWRRKGNGMNVANFILLAKAVNNFTDVRKFERSLMENSNSIQTDEGSCPKCPQICSP